MQSDNRALLKAVRAYGIAVAASALGLLLQWAIVPFGGVRTPFAFFLLAIAATTFLAGVIPGFIVLAVGALNGCLLFAPQGSFAVASIEDQSAIAIFVLVGAAFIYFGRRARLLYEKSKADEQRLERAGIELKIKVDDLQNLHDLSMRVSQTSELKKQLELILGSLVHFHGAKKGLVSLYDKQKNVLSVAASTGFSERTLKSLQGVKGGEGACGLACLEKRRVIVRDTESDACFEKFRDISRQEGFRAIHSTPMLTPEGEILGALSVHYESTNTPSEREMSLADICARKATIYIQRARAEALAGEREREMQTVLHSSGVPFCVLQAVRDDSGAIIDFSWKYVNEAATRALNRSKEELIGRNVMDVLPGTWDEPGLFEAYTDVVENKEVRQLELHSAANGIEGWFHIVASPIGDGAAIWFADVTSQRQREVELKMADRKKDEFLATLAHELRNPLAPIRQASIIARKSTATEAQRLWSQEVIDRQVHHMALLLDDLLDVSRITRGVLHLRMRPTSLIDVVNSGIETSRHLMDEKRHTLKVDVPSVEVNVDPLRMSQVVSNLLTNAAKYSNPNSSIQIIAKVHGADLTLKVSDNGIGLTREQCLSIFEMFSQVKTAEERSEGGLGIGLSLTKGLVQLHGGRIEAVSAGLGLGSTFSVFLPGAVIKSSVENRPPLRDEPASMFSRRILVADDNCDAAQSMATLLRLDGHEVTVVHDGASALESFQASEPDVALLDIGMPAMSGYEVAKRIRATDKGKDTLLIAVTGWGQQSDVNRARAAGFDFHLTKPLDYDKLSKLLNSEADAVTA